MLRRILFVSTVALASLVLLASSAFAHFCYIASRSPQGAQAAAANSDSWGSVDEFLVDELGLCSEGVDHVRSQIAETGLDPDLLVINTRTVMAQGLFNTDNLHLSSNGNGVDWISEEMFAEFEVWVGEAFGICGG